jgi:hypothetical protein
MTLSNQLVAYCDESRHYFTAAATPITSLPNMNGSSDHKITTTETLSDGKTSAVASPLVYGAMHAWGHSPHGYANTSSSSWSSVLCIDTPKFIPTDEVLIDDASRHQHPHTPATTIAGDTTWYSLMASWNNHNSGTNSNRVMRSCVPVRLSFGGSTRGQTIDLVLSPNNHSPFVQQPDAVLVLVMDTSRTRLLFVHHSKRGWELPGGKREVTHVHSA